MTKLFPLMALVLLAPLAGDQDVSSRLFEALSKVENCANWNNPGCLKYAKQKGAKRGPRGYAVFKTKALGERALALQIQRHAGETIAEFVRHYNPKVKGYLKKVLDASDGLKDTDIL